MALAMGKIAGEKIALKGRHALKLMGNMWQFHAAPAGALSLP